jgi:pentatricopeptide repeat protein
MEEEEEETSPASPSSPSAYGGESLEQGLDQLLETGAPAATEEEDDPQPPEEEEASPLSEELLSLHAALKQCLANRQPAKALRTLRAHSKRGGELDRHAYVLGLTACDRLRVWEVACELLNEAEAGGVLPSARMFLTALSATANAGRWQEATALLIRLTAAWPATGPWPYALVIRACAEAGQWERALSLHAAMLAAGVRPSVRSCGTVLLALEAALRANPPMHREMVLEQTTELLEQMRSVTEAAIFVSTHGPSLGYLLFARPRTLVVEVSVFTSIFFGVWQLNSPKKRTCAGDGRGFDN